VTERDHQSGILAWADRAGQFLENAALVGALASMIVLAGAQIVLRNFFNSGFPWADEALRLLVLWVAMLGAVAASRENRHIAIDALARVLPPGPKAWVAIVVHFFTACVALIIAWHSAQFVADSREYNDILLGDLPAWWFQAILPIGFVLIGYRYVVWFLRGIRSLVAGPSAADGTGR
jgi:TRAP-type C4-dicarboxylate transport system permease small subunit